MKLLVFTIALLMAIVTVLGAPTTGFPPQDSQDEAATSASAPLSDEAATSADAVAPTDAPVAPAVASNDVVFDDVVKSEGEAPKPTGAPEDPSANSV